MHKKLVRLFLINSSLGSTNEEINQWLDTLQNQGKISQETVELLRNDRGDATHVVITLIFTPWSTTKGK